MPRPPLLTIIGRKHSGKTTVLVRLTAELAARGWRVMSIKHGTHTFNMDPANTDTYRHYHEGRVARVAMVAPDKFALVARHDREPTPEEVAERYMQDADLVVCEGFKRSALPRIEVYRRAAHAEPIYAAGSHESAQHIAMVTDVDDLELPIPIVRLSDDDWPSQLAHLVEQRMLAGRVAASTQTAQ
ncbi:MAG TPA: molybdopterin-guanine dinucleotide biosynthesis protein B [Gemmatimonadaceae bacterium]|nr:molybdopterin-guanine dinucleotide biosynthesis protein B [Gemmatimonadaceae bacterium]